jgi:SAM-dependent methyltransferase
MAKFSAWFRSFSPFSAVYEAGDSATCPQKGAEANCSAAADRRDACESAVDRPIIFSIQSMRRWLTNASRSRRNTVGYCGFGAAPVPRMFVREGPSDLTKARASRGAVRESGMPPRELWSSFFDVESLLDEIEVGLPPTMLELGAGYGLFTLPLARRCGRMTTVEIDSSLCAELSDRIAKQGQPNITIANFDFFDHERLSKLGSFDAIVLFNILHMEKPDAFLETIHDVAAPDCRVHVLHWRTDIETPRGPSLPIRSTPEECKVWFGSSGFELLAHFNSSAAPFHFVQQYRPVTCSTRVRQGN